MHGKHLSEFAKKLILMSHRQKNWAALDFTMYSNHGYGKYMLIRIQVNFLISKENTLYCDRFWMYVKKFQMNFTIPYFELARLKSSEYTLSHGAIVTKLEI